MQPHRQTALMHLPLLEPPASVSWIWPLRIHGFRLERVRPDDTGWLARQL